MSDRENTDRMMDFQLRQPTTFHNAALVMICGKLDEGESLTESCTAQLLRFLKEASHRPVEMKTGFLFNILSTCFPDKFRSGDSGKANAPSLDRDAHASAVTSAPHSAQHPVQPPPQLPPQHHTQHPAQLPAQYFVQNPVQPSVQLPAHYLAQHSAQHSSQNPIQHPPHSPQYHVQHSVQDSAPHIAQQSPPSSRPIGVSICTSALEYNVKGLMTKLTELKTIQPQLVADVRFRELPYNNIDSFKFPSSDPVDVMVLCHSVHNRGFAITDVMNSIYDKYLKYCSKEIGKKKLAVIVHDITDWNPAAVHVKMDTFQKSQPLTFQLVDTVVICGSLENPEELKMSEIDIARLISFFESASLEPRKKASSVL